LSGFEFSLTKTQIPQLLGAMKMKKLMEIPDEHKTDHRG
jgi:hypothetical protein